MICRKHGVEMLLVHEPPKVTVTAPLHRCPTCTAEFRSALKKATDGPMQFNLRRSRKQRTLPPVIMSERWP